MMVRNIILEKGQKFKLLSVIMYIANQKLDIFVKNGILQIAQIAWKASIENKNKL